MPNSDGQNVQASSENTPLVENAAGHGTVSDSNTTRYFFCVFHAVVLGLVAWLLLGHGLDDTFHLSYGDELRRVLLFVASALYFLRLTYGTFFLVVRSMSWAEVVPVALLLGVSHILFAFGGNVQERPNWVFWLGVVLVVNGSFLNTGSEVQRKWWKARPENKGKIMTTGMWALAMHINYFGDTLLFSGWAMMSGKYWSISIPAMMVSGFIFQHIPELDKYLESRYGDQFREYAAKTKKLVPFIY